MTAVLNEISTKLEQLQQEFTAGEEQLGDLIRREANLRETLLRISGAIQVLRELIEASTTEPTAPQPNESPPARAGAVLTVP